MFACIVHPIRRGLIYSWITLLYLFFKNTFSNYNILLYPKCFCSSSTLTFQFYCYLILFYWILTLEYCFIILCSYNYRNISPYICYPNVCFYCKSPIELLYMIRYRNHLISSYHLYWHYSFASYGCILF